MENTKEQERAIDAYALKILANGVKCGIKTDMKKAKQNIAWLYKTFLGCDAPKKIVLVKSPEAAIKAMGGGSEMIDDVLFVSLWSWWVAFYWGGMNILGVTEGVEKDLIDETNEYEKIIHELFAILPAENTCFVIEYPKNVSIKNNDLDAFILHREGGLALEFQDGTGFAWLNGIEVPDWVACLPPSKLSVKKIMAEQNTDVRREGLKRIGISRLLKETNAKILDARKATKKCPWNSYRLFEADFRDGRLRRFLEMKNPSTGDVHIEQVDISCSTIDEAKAMQDREAKYVEPEIIT